MNVQNRKGSAIPLVLIVSALVAIFSYVVFGMLQSRRSSTEDDLRALQAKMLAQDIIELGKYMLLYERVIYLDDPLAISTARVATRKEFLNQSYGSLIPANSYMMNACGGYDANAVEVGNFIANGSPVFCPFYLRNPLMDGSMFEDMLLEMWSRASNKANILTVQGGAFVTIPTSRNAIMTMDSSGAYTVTMDLTKAITETDNQFIRLHLSQNIVEWMRKNKSTAKLTYKLFGTSTGFTTMSNERFVTIQADISFGSGLTSRSVNSIDSLIMYSSTVKDFAIFMMYPEDSSGKATTSFDKAMEFGGTDTRINGRVFFNGDLDTPLAKLPVFNEVVLISGALKLNGLSADQARVLLAQKFKKGLVVGFPVKRLVNDGECVAGVPTANASGMYCKNPAAPTLDFTIANYITGLGNMCSDLNVTYSKGVYLYDLTNVKDPIKKQQCTGSAPEKVFLSGGATNVTVSGSHAYIVSPIKNLDVAGGAYIYGTVLGGHLKAGNGSRFHSLGSMRKGLPGIASDTDLEAISTESERIMAGVGVPLINVPLVKEATIGK